MKQTIKKIVSLLVVLCLSMSMLMLVACKNDPDGEGKNSSNQGATSVEQPNSNDSGDDSTKPGSSDGPQTTVDDIKLEDRANYNAQTVGTAYLESSVYDVMYTPDVASKNNMKGYLLGDIYNMVITQAQSIIAQDPSLAGVKLDIFTFSRDTNGDWRNFNRATVHPIVNKLLNYKLDSDEGFALTEAELRTYGKVQLFSLLRESIANTKVVYNNETVTEGNANLTATLNKTLDGLYESLNVPMVKQTLDATVADFTMLVAGTPTEQGDAFNKLYGTVKVGELASMFAMSSNLPVEIAEMTLSQVKTWVDQVNAAGGFAVYFQNIFNQMVETVMPMTMGEVMMNFGITLPENLAAYTVGQVVAELQAMIAPQPTPDTSAPAPVAEGEGTTDTTTGTEQKSFFAEFTEYFSKQDVVFSDTVVLKGQELINFVNQLTSILTKPYQGTTLEKFDAMVKELNTFVTTNEKVMTDVVASFDASGITVSFDGVKMLKPSEAFAVLKDFLKQGETYQAYMNMLTTTTVEQYLTANGAVIPVTDVEKVDNFVNTYKAKTLANFINNMSTFQAELVELDASLTLKDELVLSGYGFLAENTAIKTFMATYGDMTQAQINEKTMTDTAFAEAYTNALMTLYKGLKLKDLVAQPVA